MSVNLSHCARCAGRTETVWRHSKAFCGVCGSSHAEMAAAGLNTAGPWHDCPFCQDRHYYERDRETLRCEKCHLTAAEAGQKAAERPQMIRFRPERVTPGALLEIQYWSGRPLQPALLMISWLPQHGTTTVRLDPSQERDGANLYSLSIEVPHGATRALVTDRTGRSRRCEIPIDYVSQPSTPVIKKWWQLLIGR
jgi:hypothetical protein